MRTNFQALYEAKKSTVRGCLDEIQSGDVVAFAACCNAPVAIMSEMHTLSLIHI